MVSEVIRKIFLEMVFSRDEEGIILAIKQGKVEETVIPRMGTFKMHIPGHHTKPQG